MSQPESPQDKATTTEQIAAAGTAGREDRTNPLGDMRGDQPGSATQRAADGARDTGDQPRAQLLEEDELQSIRGRWKDIQAEFVDEPTKAVQEADALVADLMQRLARVFASERDQIESSWASGGGGSTEELRRGLRRYRSFFERLLAA